MSMRAHVVLMAAYNETMNGKLYAAAARLDPRDLYSDRGAFFGSLFATLNHIMVGDTIWLKRFSGHPSRHPALDALRAAPAPTRLAQAMAQDLPTLRALREELDRIIRNWAGQLTDADLEHILCYAGSTGAVSRKRFSSLVMHLFNHQTHHRGQASTMLSQSGIDIGVTDLLALIDNVPEPGAGPA